MNKLIAVLGLAGIVALLGYACAFQVQENEYVVVTRFGDPRRVVDEAGLHFRWPAPIDALVRIDGRVHVLDPKPDECLTQEQKNLNVDSFLAWSVEDPGKYLVSVSSREDAELRLTDILRSVVGDVISSHPFEHIVSQDEQPVTLKDISEEITRIAREKARQSFGVKVEAVRIKRLNFPAQNKRAVFRRMEAERESIAQGFRSEGVEQYDKIRADADRERAALVAEAERKAAELRGEAEAEATRIYNEAYSKDPELYRFLRSLELLEDVLGENTTLILPSDHELLKILSGPDLASEPDGESDRGS